MNRGASWVPRTPIGQLSKWPGVSAPWNDFLVNALRALKLLSEVTKESKSKIVILVLACKLVRS